MWVFITRYIMMYLLWNNPVLPLGTLFHGRVHATSFKGQRIHLWHVSKLCASRQSSTLRNTGFNNTYCHQFSHKCPWSAGTLKHFALKRHAIIHMVMYQKWTDWKVNKVSQRRARSRPQVCSVCTLLKVWTYGACLASTRVSQFSGNSAAEYHGHKLQGVT